MSILCSVILLALAACGGGDDDGETNGPADEEITIEMGEDPDAVNYFDPSEITVTAGSTVTFNLVNIGQTLHNMRIAGPDNRYNTDDDVAIEDYVDAGNSTSLTWEVPDEPGTYKFQCDIHPVDMVGTFTVE
jgi:plastocyanin